MTVHGAKGLEAAVVFMVDTTTSPKDSQRLNLIHLPHGNAPPGAPGVTVWAGRKADDPAAVAAARAVMQDETEDEYRRLLYVAMTRAAERLIVGGIQPGNRKEVRENSWYDLIAKGLDKGLEASSLHVEEIETDHGPVKRYTRDGTVASDTASATASDEPKTIVLPPWLRVPAPGPSRREQVVRPSDPVSDNPHPVDAREQLQLRARALQRGTLVHRLLQSLPEVESARRRAAAEHFLSRARDAAAWSDDDRAALASQVLALLDDPRFAAVFAPGSRAEASIVGRLTRPHGGTVLVNGQIDRLVIAKDEVLIVDFKTNHAPPRNPAGAPAAYLHQLALYRAVLAQLYPDRVIRAALLWTELPEMMEISAAALDANLASALA